MGASVPDCWYGMGHFDAIGPSIPDAGASPTWTHEWMGLSGPCTGSARRKGWAASRVSGPMAGLAQQLAKFGECQALKSGGLGNCAGFGMPAEAISQFPRLCLCSHHVQGRAQARPDGSCAQGC